MGMSAGGLMLAEVGSSSLNVGSTDPSAADSELCKNEEMS